MCVGGGWWVHACMHASVCLCGGEGGVEWVRVCIRVCVWVRVWVRACVRACVCVWVRACVGACVPACVWGGAWGGACVCVRRVYGCVRVCVIAVKCPALPPCATDGRYRNPLYYDYNNYKRFKTQLQNSCSKLV